MKVTTTPGDCDKVNQIVPIMQEHLGPVMNLARIKLLAFVLHALCIVQTVSLHKIASAMPTGVERDSNLRRLQRFLAGYALNLELIAKVIFALLRVKRRQYRMRLLLRYPTHCFPTNSRSATRESIHSAPNSLINLSISRVRSFQLELPRLSSMVKSSGNATPCMSLQA